MMWQLKFQDAIAEGRAEGRAESTLAAIQNLMETLGLPVEKAMAALRIPENEREHYAQLLSKQ